MEQGIPRSEVSVARLTCVGAKKGVKVPRFGVRTLGWHAQQPAYPPYLVPFGSLVSTLQYRGHTRQVIHHPCFGTGHSRRFRRTSNQSMLVHHYWLTINISKKNTNVTSLIILDPFQLISQREHPRRCRRPRQVAAAVSH